MANSYNVHVQGFLQRYGIRVQKVSWDIHCLYVFLNTWTNMYAGTCVPCCTQECGALNVGVAAVVWDQGGLRRRRQQDCAPGRCQRSPKKLILLLEHEVDELCRSPLAILELLKCHARVLYIDIDVHHGDGVGALPPARHLLVDSATAPTCSSCC